MEVLGQSQNSLLTRTYSHVVPDTFPKRDDPTKGH
jgi:hypothetical protein